MDVSKVAFVMYPVSDIQRSTTFYTEVVGLQKSGLESPAWVEFDVDGFTFGIGNFEQVGVPGTAGSLALEVADIADAKAALEAKSVQTADTFETPVCFISGFSDPDGNRVLLHQAKPA